MHDLTHASFFSGVGGLDMGLERAGWRTVSFSEIDPYASAVLVQRWPGVPNLGDITAIADRWRSGQSAIGACVGCERGGTIARHREGCPARAALWTGGFPCQDLSVAGKRRGLAGSRSGLAFAFLDLVERHRPPLVLLENVPGLLSSHGGRDMGALCGRLEELGYVGAYRTLDARYFGVPQRRRRVFILGIHARLSLGADSAAEVLSVGSRCRQHPPTGVEAGPGGAERVGDRPAFTLRRDPGGTTGQGWNTNYVQRPPPDSGGMRAPDGLARRSHDRGGVAGTLREHPRPGSNSNGALVAAQFVTENQRGEVRLTDDSFSLAQGGGKLGQGYAAVLGSFGASGMNDDPLLPLGLDSHRYRCCGNGVVADVGEWIGRQLLAALERVA